MKKDKEMYNKSNTISVRLSVKELEKLEFIRMNLSIRDHSKVIRELIKTEFNKIISNM